MKQPSNSPENQSQILVGSVKNNHKGTVIPIKPTKVGDHIIENVIVHDDISTLPPDKKSPAYAEFRVQGGHRIHNPNFIDPQIIESLVFRDEKGLPIYVGRNHIQSPPENPPNPLQQIQQSITQTLPPHLQFVQDNPRSESLIPSQLKNLKQASQRNPDPYTIISRQLENLQTRFVSQVIREAYDQAAASQRSPSETATEVFDKTVNRFIDANPLAETALSRNNREVIKANIVNSLTQNQNNPILPQDAAADFDQQLNQSLEFFGYQDPQAQLGEKKAVSLFDNEDEKAVFVAHLKENLKKAPAYTAQEIVENQLALWVVNKRQGKFAPEDYRAVRNAVSQTAEALSPSAQFYQDSNAQNMPGTTPSYSPRDYLSDLGLGHRSPLSKRSGIVGNYAINKTFSNLSEQAPSVLKNIKVSDLNQSLGTSAVNQLAQKYGSDFLTVPEGQQVVVQLLFSGETLNLLQKGYTSKDIAHMGKSFKNTPLGYGAADSSPQMKQLALLEKKLALSESLLRQHPNLIHWYGRFQQTQGRIKNTALRTLDPLGLRYKVARIRQQLGKQLFNLEEKINPLTYLAKPLLAFEAVTQKLNPFLYIHKYTTKAKKYVRRKIGNAAVNLGLKIAQKWQGKLFAKIGSKLLLKAGFAILGISTGGIGTLIAIVSLAKDVWDLFKDKLKKIIPLAVAGLYALIAAILKLIQAIGITLASMGMGAAIGAILGFGIPGAIIGGLIGYGVSAIINNISALGKAISGGASSISAGLGQVLSGSAQAAASTTAIGIGGAGTLIIAGQIFYNVAFNEVNTLDVQTSAGSFGSIAMDGLCWPTTGRVSWTPEAVGHGRSPGGTPFDIASSLDTPIYSPFEGDITYAGWCAGGYGNCVMMNARAQLLGGQIREFRLIFAHFANIARPPGRVSQGDYLGAMGFTGNVWPPGIGGTHLHYEAHSIHVRQIVPEPNAQVGYIITGANRCAAINLPLEPGNENSSQEI